MKKRDFKKIDSSSNEKVDTKKFKTNKSSSNTTKKGDNDSKDRKPTSKFTKGDKKQYTPPANYKAAKPNFQLVENLKSDWNKVRVKSLSTEDRNKLMQKMADKVKGKILQITLRHDVSRIVQSILQFGTNTLRSAVLTEISSKVLDISKTPCKNYNIYNIILEHFHFKNISDQTNLFFLPI